MNKFNIYDKKTNNIFINNIEIINIGDNIHHNNTTTFGIIIDDYSTLKYLFEYESSKLKKIKYIFIDQSFINDPYLHLYYFSDKIIYINYIKNKVAEKKIMLNPTIQGFYNIDKILENYEIKVQIDIKNDICYIDINNILKLINNDYNYKIIINKIKKVWGYFLIYSIYNLHQDILKENTIIMNFYEKLISDLGIIINCHPVNDKTKKYSNSRDIKYTPDTNHFYSSNIRQPLHNDYAYYPKNISADWLLLFALEQSEYGGYTSLITVHKLKKILLKYNKKLYDRIINEKIVYKYQDIKLGDIIHTKYLLDDNCIINWNYFQIKNELNNKEVVEVKNLFFNFLEKYITDGDIYTLKKKWNKGDGIIFNDHLNLHQRTSFLGSRWLKDHAIIDNNLKLDTH